HPGDPNFVFLGTSGGGIWVANLSTNYPFWTPITDNLGALAIGAIAIDSHFNATNGQVTVWVGLGDAFDQQSGVIVKGTYTPGDLSGIWGTPIQLGSPAHPADGFPTAPPNIREIRLDPTDSTRMLVA